MKYLILSAIALSACHRPAEPAPGRQGTVQALPLPEPAPPPCTMKVHFYDVAQGLAVLVDLPGGKRVMVDTGDAPHRAGCGDTCANAHMNMMASLQKDLNGMPIDMLWITHQHADHIGGAPFLMQHERVGVYVDNGRAPLSPEVAMAHAYAKSNETFVTTVDPWHTTVPLTMRPGEPVLTAILPHDWPKSCHRDENDCSIGLRIEACGSSVVFMGDAEHEEEALVDLGGHADLLQVGHHGSATSTSTVLLSALTPRYAVISAGHPKEGENIKYKHPRAQTVRRLSSALGANGASMLKAYDGSDWIDMQVSDNLFATERDGNVVLVTNGGGTFKREP